MSFQSLSLAPLDSSLYTREPKQKVIQSLSLAPLDSSLYTREPRAMW